MLNNYFSIDNKFIEFLTTYWEKILGFFIILCRRLYKTRKIKKSYDKYFSKLNEHISDIVMVCELQDIDNFTALLSFDSKNKKFYIAEIESFFNDDQV